MSIYCVAEESAEVNKLPAQPQPAMTGAYLLCQIIEQHILFKLET